MDQSNKVYAAIAKVATAIASEGIAKNKKNTQQGYTFRGIDDIYNALSRSISDAGLVIIPRIVKREVREMPSKSGGVLFYVTVEAEYDFVSVEDGSTHTARVFGEAMDSGDKATNKAMSAAYKYLCLQTFCIPTEGDNDADATTHHVDTEAALKDALVKLNANCDTVDHLTMLKSTLPAYVKEHPKFLTAAMNRYNEITKPAQPVTAETAAP